jgi:segregation and condensation protein A
MNLDTYTIKIAQFEGPFDLLLFFIERDELDIYNIPIARITDEFLAYIRHLETLNIDVASEFILVAATLMRIKAKMLLPRRELDEQGKEIDPRQELVERLLEYKRYKTILDDMRSLEADRWLREKRGNISEELQSLANQALAEAEMESVTLFKLLKAFDKVMREFEDRNTKVTHTVVKYPYTIEQERENIVQRIASARKMTFQSVFDDCKTRLHAIHVFLAILELVQMRNIDITLGEGANNFWLEALD